MQNNKKGLILVETEDEKYFIDSEGIRQGKYINFTLYGNILEIRNYVDNQLHGKYIRYDNHHKNIIEYECNYFQGLLHGEYIEYYPSGRIKTKYNIFNGKAEGECFKYENKENSTPQIIHYRNGVECDKYDNTIQVKNARKKV